MQNDRNFNGVFQVVGSRGGGGNSSCPKDALVLVVAHLFFFSSHVDDNNKTWLTPLLLARKLPWLCEH